MTISIANLGKTGREAGVGAGDLWIKMVDEELGDADESFFLVHFSRWG